MKFYGHIGYIHEGEIRPGIWDGEAEERESYGDVISDVRHWLNDSDIADSIGTNNKLSVIADRFLCEHMGAMRYVRWNGTVWEIKSVDLVRPRAILTLGGVYNGKQKDPEEEGETGPEETPEPDDSGEDSGTEENQNGRWWE